MSTLTIEHIARLADVSRSTVSRVLNDHPNVRPNVRERVLRVIEEHGYAPRAAARSLASRRTNVITLLIPRSAAVIFSDPFFSQVIQGISETCTNRGFFLMLSMVTADIEPDFYRSFLRSGQFDGVIMLSSDVDDPILPRMVNDGIRLVLIGRHPYFENLTWVDVENRDGARQAVEHLIALGHRRIATITGPLQMAAAADRRDGYKQALLEAGIAIDPRLIVEGDFTHAGAARAMERILTLPEHDRPTAVFVASDTMATAAMRVIHGAGLSIPDDISVVGFDDLPFAALATPPLTTVAQPIYQMGVTAVDMLIDQLDQPSAECRHVCLDARLVVRRSSGPPASPAAAQKGG